MLARSVVAASVLAAFANAQTVETSSASSVAASSTVSQSMPPAATAAFNPASIDSTTRFNWCHAQLNNCPQICGGAASINQCDQTALTYSCICPNGTVPDVTAFADTLPFFICQETYIQCVQNNPNDAQAQSVCADNEQCGTRNATGEAIAATSAAGASATTTSAGSGSASSSASGATGSGSSAASSAAASATGSSNDATTAQFATGAFAVVFMAAFKLFL